jgi:peptide/nickel transport system permease protein
VDRHSLAARLATSLVVMAVVALLTFLLLDLAPGSYLDELRLNPQVSSATLERMRVQYALDRPFYSKFWEWGRRAVVGDFGDSLVYQRPIRQLVAERVWNTVLLNLVALSAAWTLGVALGLIGAAARDSPADWAISAATATLLAMPGVVVAVILLAGAARFGLPIGGAAAPAADAADFVRHLALPAAAVALVWLPAIARHTRSAVLSALDAPYMLAARAKGVGPWRLIGVHAFREALVPLAGLFGLSLSGLLSASLVVEVVMSWPGLGQLAYDAVLKRDIFLIVDLVLASAALLIVGNTVGDLLLRRVDPRTAGA